MAINLWEKPKNNYNDNFDNILSCINNMQNNPNTISILDIRKNISTLWIPEKLLRSYKKREKDCNDILSNKCPFLNKIIKI